jgi:hypothetical protein
MNQDNANQPIVAEEPLASDQNPATRVDPASEQTTTDSQVAEPVTEEVEEDFAEAEEEEETEVASLDEATETETSSPSDSNATITPTPSAPEADADDRCEIAKQPYDFDHCTVQIAIQLLPDDQGRLGDGDANGRMVVVGVRSHLDAPILRLVRLNELGPLPPLVGELLDALKAELPTREQAAREAFEKKKEEKEKRKATVTASKTTRGNKTKTTLATAPASQNATTDHRPRPEVQATAAPQQQMGLF